MKSDLREYKKTTKNKFNAEFPVGEYLAVIPVLNIEIYTKFGISIQPHLNKNNPDVANEGWRNSGNQFGLPRMLNLLEDLNIPFDACLNSDVLEQEPYVWESLSNVKVPYSITGHGINNSFVLPTNDGNKEKYDFTIEYVKETLDIIEKKTQRRPKGWLSPGFSIPFYLNEVLKKLGLKYTLDSTEGEEITIRDGLYVIPYSMETNDVSLCVSLQRSNQDFGDSLIDHIQTLSDEAYHSKKPKIVCIGLHTFIAGQPGRSQHLKRALSTIKEMNGVWFTNFDLIFDKKIHFTGFGSFGDVTENPTQLLMGKLKGLIEKDQLKNTTCNVLEVKTEIVDEYFKKLEGKCSHNDIFLHFGVDASSKKVSLERRGVNTIKEFTEKRKIDLNQESNYKRKTKIDVDLLSKKLNETLKEELVEPSDDAGTYLCNYIYFKSMEFGEKHGCKSLFVHVPHHDTLDLEKEFEILNLILKHFSK